MTRLHFMVSQVSHWSCCGALQLEAPCQLAGGSEGSAASKHDSDEVTSCELDTLMQVL
jgi:hypothetical protein